MSPFIPMLHNYNIMLICLSFIASQKDKERHTLSQIKKDGLLKLTITLLDYYNYQKPIWSNCEIDLGSSSIVPDVTESQA